MKRLRVNKMVKSQNSGKGRFLFLVAFILCTNGLCAKTQWHKYFHLGELTEFNRATLEMLRQPLEDRRTTITRANYTVEYPCSFMLDASINIHTAISPVVVTHMRKDVRKERICKKSAAYKTAACIDIHCEISQVPFSELSKMKAGEPSEKIRERVIKARQIQEARFKDFKGIHCNAQMTERMLHQFAEPDAVSMDMLRMAMERLKLSARAYSRILKVARTIADLDNSENVQSQHIAEAIGYRNLDRGDWAERGL